MHNELSHEDSLRLNVLMAANPVHAIRIDEPGMTLHALTEGGEARIRLHPDCRPDQYVARVKEFLGGHALGSPRGYPVYLQRWTRMGQTSDRKLDVLLLLGEPEAVVAVAQAPGLTDELARRVWWCQPTMEIARWMLEKNAVIQGTMGKVLADFLVEHLAFEEDPDSRMHTIRLVLHGKLADEETTARLWRQAKGVPYYFIGFLEFMPENLPEDQPARADYAEAEALLQPLADAGNTLAERFLALLSANGQTWLHAVREVLARPATPLVVHALLDAIGRYFCSTGYPIRTEALEDLQAAAAGFTRDERDAPPAVQAMLAVAPRYREHVEAMLLLSGLTRSTADPWLMRNTAVGALMRRKLEPVFTPIDLAAQRLRTPEGAP
ncbi:MAG TPA: hypothetical protein PK725_15570 [Rhodocyclaceae bacterium]|nr:hypothetical protein [Rhodocyclaceae bacterium]